MGKAKYLFIYLFSAISGSLLSITLNQAGVSIGASGAIFGLMGSLLYFGYHHRVYLGNVITSQIIPLIVLNLIVGFASGGQIDNFAHIGILFTMALGVKYKSSRSEMINGWLISLIFITFLVLISFGIIV
jgi:rhomboid protease GluP